jgi:hypothetical protein
MRADRVAPAQGGMKILLSVSVAVFSVLSFACRHAKLGILPVKSGTARVSFRETGLSQGFRV